jgi:hypothetical protein
MTWWAAYLWKWGRRDWDSEAAELLNLTRAALDAQIIEPATAVGRLSQSKETPKS